MDAQLLNQVTHCPYFDIEHTTSLFEISPTKNSGNHTLSDIIGSPLVEMARSMVHCDDSQANSQVFYLCGKSLITSLRSFYFTSFILPTYLQHKNLVNEVF